MPQAPFSQEVPSCVGGPGVAWRAGEAARAARWSTPGGLERLGSLGRCAWAQGVATDCRGYRLYSLGVLKP